VTAKNRATVFAIFDNFRVGSRISPERINISKIAKALDHLQHIPCQAKQECPADARVTRDSAVIPRWPSAAILDIIEPEVAPFDPPTPKTLA